MEGRMKVLEQILESKTILVSLLSLACICGIGVDVLNKPKRTKIHLLNFKTVETNFNA